MDEVVIEVAVDVAAVVEVDVDDVAVEVVELVEDVDERVVLVTGVVVDELVLVVGIPEYTARSSNHIWCEVLSFGS